MTNKVTAVFSGRQFSGKDTAAKILLMRFPSFKRIGIADAIKKKYSLRTGLSIEQIEADKPKYRQDLINLGNWGRAQNPDYWLNEIAAYQGNTIVTDIRVKHELDFFRSAGAFAVRIEASRDARAKRGILAAENDDTETALDDINDWDFIIYNEGGYDELEQNVEKLSQSLIAQFGNRLYS